MWIFITDYHPLVKHIIGLVDRFGIDENDFIPWTDYAFNIISLSTEYTNGYIRKNGATLIQIENNDPENKYYWWKTLFTEVRKIKEWERPKEYVPWWS